MSIIPSKYTNEFKSDAVAVVQPKSLPEAAWSRHGDFEVTPVGAGARCLTGAEGVTCAIVNTRGCARSGVGETQPSVVGGERSVGACNSAVLPGSPPQVMYPLVREMAAATMLMPTENWAKKANRATNHYGEPIDSGPVFSWR